MRLLIITQVVDRRHPVLGFFHHWLEAFAGRCERLTVICLQAGEYDLPSNVRVLSLGKEGGESRLKYLFRFYRHLWRERYNYDSIFVHMNREYVLLAGWWWKLWGKKVYLWSNHQSGNLLTDLAACFCDKIFCTSRYSFTAKYRKTVFMPVGIDAGRFKRDEKIAKISKSVLFLSRVAPVKKPDLLLEALGRLRKRGINFSASFYGDPLPRDREYYEALKRRAADADLADRVRFHSGIPNDQTVRVYNEHQFCVNLSPSGMYDKTIFEAAACETLPLVSNPNLRGEIDERLIFETDSLADLSAKLAALLVLPAEELGRLGRESRQYVIAKHSLDLLARKLFHEIF